MKTENKDDETVALKGLILEDAIQDAHLLRYQVLTPLIAFDLISQLKKDKKDVDEQLINETITKIKELAKGDFIRYLCDTIKDDSLKVELKLLLKNDLEIYSRSFHMKLVEIAKKIEHRILQLEKRSQKFNEQ